AELHGEATRGRRLHASSERELALAVDELRPDDDVRAVRRRLQRLDLHADDGESHDPSGGAYVLRRAREKDLLWYRDLRFAFSPGHGGSMVTAAAGPVNGLGGEFKLNSVRAGTGADPARLFGDLRPLEFSRERHRSETMTRARHEPTSWSYACAVGARCSSGE